MYGSGRGVLTGIFKERGIRHVAIRQELNPLFPDINPEPIIPHVAMLQQTVLKEDCDAGLATDGDADRIGAVAEDGSFVDSHKIFSVVTAVAPETKKMAGRSSEGFQHHAYGRSHCGKAWPKIKRMSHRIQVHR